MNQERMLIIGANGQLGKALQTQYPKAQAVDSKELDITTKPAVDTYPWENVDVIINAAAYTNVDAAETAEGRVAAWQVNAEAVSNLIHPARRNNLIIVHISTDYVFDGSHGSHSENELFSPLSVYGSSKAAGDLLVAQLDSHYILRTSWVIGDGKNFVRTMLDLGKKCINPSVVNDQIGRLTFTSELVKAIDHLLQNRAPYGTYNVSNGGKSVSWAEITRQIFTYANLPNTVSETTTKEYYKGKDFIAPRPKNSELDLSKIEGIGFKPVDWQEDLKKYIAKELG